MEHENGRIQGPMDPDFSGAEIALRRAAKKARRRAIETTGSFPVYQDGKVVYYNEADLARIDPEWKTAN